MNDEIVIRIEKIRSNMILLKRDVDTCYYLITTINHNSKKTNNPYDIFYISFHVFDKKNGDGIRDQFIVEAVDTDNESITDSIIMFMDGFCMDTLDQNDDFFASYEVIDIDTRKSIEKTLQMLIDDYDSVKEFEQEVFSLNSKIIKSFVDMASDEMQVILYDSDNTNIECTCTECGKSKFLTDRSFTIRKKFSNLSSFSYQLGLPRITEKTYNVHDFYSTFWKEITTLSLLKDNFMSIKDSFDTQKLLETNSDIRRVTQNVLKTTQDITVSCNLEFPRCDIRVDNPDIEIITTVEVGYYDFKKDQENWSIIMYIVRKSRDEVLFKKEFPNRYVMDNEFNQNTPTDVCIIADLIADTTELNLELKNVIENITGFELIEKEFLTGLEKLVLENIKRKRG